jgi:hypothetical protein
MEKQMNDRHWFRSAGELCKRIWSFAGWVEGVGYVILADSCYVVPRSNCATNSVRDQNAETDPWQPVPLHTSSKTSQVRWSSHDPH